MPEITVLPPLTDAHWRDVATGRIEKPWALLAMKIMMTRIRNSVTQDSSIANIDKCAREIHAFFEKNLRLAQPDLAAILG